MRFHGFSTSFCTSTEGFPVTSFATWAPGVLLGHLCCLPCHLHLQEPLWGEVDQLPAMVPWCQGHHGHHGHLEQISKSWEHNWMRLDLGIGCPLWVKISFKKGPNMTHSYPFHLEKCSCAPHEPKDELALFTSQAHSFRTRRETSSLNPISWPRYHASRNLGTC